MESTCCNVKLRGMKHFLCYQDIIFSLFNELNFIFISALYLDKETKNRFLWQHFLERGKNDIAVSTTDILVTLSGWTAQSVIHCPMQ